MLSQCTFQLCTHHLSLAIRKPPNAKMPYDKRETNACSHSLMQYAALTRCFSSTCSPPSSPISSTSQTLFVAHRTRSSPSPSMLQSPQ